MVFIVIVIMIFAGVGLFLLSLAEGISQTEYINLYTNRLLASVLKTDTGSTDPSCKTVSDLLACSFLTPTYVCGGQDCFSLANQTVSDQMERFGLIKEQFRYVFLVEPVGFVALPQGEPFTVAIGESSLQEERIEKIISTQRIQKVLGGNSYLMSVSFVVARKGRA